MVSILDRKKFEALGLMPLRVNGKIIGVHKCVDSLIKLSNATKLKVILYKGVYALQDGGLVIPVAVAKDGGDRLEPVTCSSDVQKFMHNQEFTSIDLSNVYVDDRCENLLAGCASLIKVDVSNFNTSKVTSMYSMFAGCMRLVSLDLSNFDTSKVTNMCSMFENCKELRYLNLSNFDTRNISVTGIRSMFYGCDNLKSVIINKERNPRIISQLRSLGAVPSASAFWYRKIKIEEPA